MNSLSKPIDNIDVIDRIQSRVGGARHFVNTVNFVITGPNLIFLVLRSQ